MSEVIEDFIRRNPSLPEGESFEAFLREPRIRAWVGDDASRRERLQREFSRVWTDLRASSSASGPATAALATTRPAAPAPPAAVPARPVPPPAPTHPTPHAPAHAPPQPPVPAPRAPPAPSRADVHAHEAHPHAHAAARRLHLLCPACHRVDVWLQGGAITCHHCGTRYDDMLALVPVKPVGPFEYVFGEGLAGILTAAGVVLLLLAVYGVLTWL